MKSLKIILSLALLTIFLSSCNKESVDKQSSDKMNEKKEALSTEKISNKEVTNKVSDDIKLFKVDKVEKSSGKKVAPDIFWTDNGKQTS
ncbi:MAG: hypothetical protein LH629_15795, partial [Ignavibacteria bacterium]|nr:hypothetical protein [Ignavibacteria bacterium]